MKNICFQKKSEIGHGGPTENCIAAEKMAGKPGSTLIFGIALLENLNLVKKNKSHGYSTQGMLTG